ncbi:MAG: PCRF domain-containing protein, partial [Candidatus Puniceispirillales bacterium]
MSLQNNLSRILDRRVEIENQLNDAAQLSSDEMMQLSKELSDLRPIAEQAEQVQKITANLESAKALLAEAEGDTDMIAMAEEEIDALGTTLEQAEHDLKIMLLPKDKDDERNAILEVRA